MTTGTFLLSLSGQLEWIDNILPPAGSCWHCKYEFVAGTDWKIVAGIESGLTQTATVVRNGEKVVFNMPLEIVFKSTNPYGWPQIVLSVYKDMKLQGYGRIHVPFQPGCHQLSVKLAKPLATSFLGYLGSFFGYEPELLQPNVLATTTGSNLIRMVSNGEAQLSVNIIFQNFQTLGYDVAAKYPPFTDKDVAFIKKNLPLSKNANFLIKNFSWHGELRTALELINGLFPVHRAHRDVYTKLHNHTFTVCDDDILQ